MRTYTYIAFDGDSDYMSYLTILNWSADPGRPFRLRDAHDINYAHDDSLPESIIAQLRQRLEASRNLVLLVGDKTRYNRRGILQYEIRYALREGLPIILAFIGYRESDWDYASADRLWARLEPRIPAVLRDAPDRRGCLVAPFAYGPLTRAVAAFDHLHFPATNFSGYMWCWL